MLSSLYLFLSLSCECSVNEFHEMKNEECEIYSL